MILEKQLIGNKPNTISTETNVCFELAIVLNELLANYSIFHQNVKGYSLNIAGKQFFNLRSKFDALHSNLLVKIDKIAERVLVLGNGQSLTFSPHLLDADINESFNVTRGDIALIEILQAFQIILTKQRLILKLASKINDQNTVSLINGNIREQEKLVWLYSAFLNL